MKTKRACLIIIVSLSLFGFIYCAHQKTYSGDIENEEYEVYKAIIETHYLSQPGYIDLKNSDCEGKIKTLLPKTIIIIDETIDRSSAVERVDGPLEEFLTELPEQAKTMNLKTIPRGAIESWEMKNTKKYLLSNHFTFSTNHLFITPTQLNESFMPTKWWDSFYKNYPNALGYFKLSRVGFDEKRTTAIVYIENTQDGLWGSGTFWVLVKENKKWKVENKYLIWLS